MFENNTNQQPNNPDEIKAWNPLEQLDDALQLQTKRLIKSILNSYTGYYDFLSEPIQNALDATARFQNENLDRDYHPQIWIRINLRESHISITDNGIGMNLKEFKSFLQPYCTYKEGLQSRGSKGVGTTYLAYGFNYLEVATKNGQENHYGVIKDGRIWAEDTENEIEVPLFKTVEKASHEIFELVEHGTSITLKLLGEFIKPKDLTWAGAKTAKQWINILRITTPLGGIYLCGEKPQKVKIELEVIDENSEITKESLTEPKYIFPHEVIGKTANIQEYFSDLDVKVQKRDDIKTSPKFLGLDGLWGEWTGKDIVDSNALINIELSEEEKILVIGTKIYVFLGYSEEIWEYYNEKILCLRRNLNILKGGLQLAVRNMPQGRSLTIPFPNHVGLQKLAHIVVHFDSEYYKNDNAEPDLGRKGFQPELVEIAEKLSIAAIQTFRKHHNLLKKDKGKSAYDAESDIEEWIDNAKYLEKEVPISLKPRLPMNSEPQIEQDVVALFNQMLGASIIRGIQILATSQYKQYDGLYRIFMENPFNDYIRSDQNPLGIDESSLRLELQSGKPRKTKIKVLEYKYNIDALIDDFNSGIKSTNEIGLVVAWEMGKKWKAGFSVTSYLNQENVHHREFHGFTHKMTHQGIGADAFHCIILKDIVSYLNSPKEESERQKQIYS
jgi:hypothetical protein